MKKVLLAGSALLVVALVSAQAPPASSSDPAFGKFVDDHFAAGFAANPLQGTSAGFHEYDAKMPDMSRAGIEKRVAELKAQLARLSALKRSNLPFDDAID